MQWLLWGAFQTGLAYLKVMEVVASKRFEKKKFHGLPGRLEGEITFNLPLQMV